MGLPKNFQQTVNLNKRVEALNDLTLYVFTYDLKFTNKLTEEIYTDENLYNSIEDFLGEVKFIGNKRGIGKTRISALDREQADKKLNEWLTKAVENEFITEYEVKEVFEKTFNEELEELGLNNILNYGKD